MAEEMETCEGGSPTHNMALQQEGTGAWIHQPWGTGQKPQFKRPKGQPDCEGNQFPELKHHQVVGEVPKLSPETEVLVSTIIYNPAAHCYCGWEQGERDCLHSPSTLLVRMGAGRTPLFTLPYHTEA